MTGVPTQPGGPLRKAIFLDRDGTVNRDTRYLIDFAHFELLPGVEDAMRIFQDLGYRLFVVSNQSGVARGYFPIEAVEALHRRIGEHLGSRGILIDEFIFCPHHPEGTVAPYAVACDCRKPKPGMLLALQARHGLDLAASYMAGDNRTDAETAVNAGATGVWLHAEAAEGDSLRLDNAGNIKEFVSLIEFAENLRGLEGRDRRGTG